MNSLTGSLGRTNDDLYKLAQQKATRQAEAVKQGNGGYGEIPGPAVAFDSPPQPGGAELLGNLAKGAASEAIKSPVIPTALGILSVLNAAHQVVPNGLNAQLMAGGVFGLTSLADAVGTQMIKHTIKRPGIRVAANVGLKTANSGLEQAAIMAAKDKEPQWNLTLGNAGNAAAEELAKRGVRSYLRLFR